MASLFIPDIKPFHRLSSRVCPPALEQTLKVVFAGVTGGLMLVGGTALAGYYAEHRLSDDLDLFASNPENFDLALRALRTLEKRGASFSGESRTPFYYRCQADFLNHSYTADLVVDENLHRFGKSHRTDEGVWVADLPTLFAMKIASLVSRSSEKDLYDVDWLLGRSKNFNVGELIQKGRLVDGGVTAETLLYSLQSAVLRGNACAFLPNNSKLTPQKVFQKIERLRKFLIRSLVEFEMKGPLTEEDKLLKAAIKSTPF